MFKAKISHTLSVSRFNFVRYLLLFFVFLLPLNSYADFSLINEYQSKGVLPWKGVAVAKGGDKIAGITFSGDLYMSRDRGAHWQKEKNFGTNILSSITMSDDGNHIVVAEFRGHIYVSHDGGSSWVTSNAPINPWQELDASSDGKFLVISGGTKLNNDSLTQHLYVSKDYGNTWAELLNSPEKEWYSASISDDGKNIVAVANAKSKDFIYLSKDSGYSWGQVSSAGENSWRSVDLSSDGKVIVASVIATVTVVADQDAGQTSLTYLNTGKPDYLYISKDSGSSWSKLLNSGIHDWREIGVSNNGKTIVGGTSDAGFLYSNDYGDTWKNYVPNLSSIDSVSLLGDGGVFAFTNQDSGFLYTSFDKGGSFSKVDFASPQNWSSVDLSKNGQYVLASPYFSFLSRSKDGGVSWIMNTKTGEFAWSDVAVSDSGKYMLASHMGDYSLSKGGLMISNDYGSSWSEVSSFKNLRVSSVDIGNDGSKMVVSVGVGGVGTSKSEDFGYIYTSNDYGKTWKTLNNLGEKRWEKVRMSGDGGVIVANTFNTEINFNSRNGLLFVSDDFGLSWEEKTDLGKQKWSKLSVSLDGSIIIIGGSPNNSVGNLIYVSKDKGKTWVKGSNVNSPTLSEKDSHIYDSRGTLLYVSEDEGKSFTKVEGVTGGDITAFSRDGIIMIQMNNSGAGSIKVFKKSDTEEDEKIVLKEKKDDEIVKEVIESIKKDTDVKTIITTPIITTPVTTTKETMSDVGKPAHISVPSVVVDPVKIKVLAPVTGTFISQGEKIEVKFETNRRGEHKIQLIAISTGGVVDIGSINVGTVGVINFVQTLTQDMISFGGYKVRVCYDCDGKDRAYGEIGNFIFKSGTPTPGYGMDTGINFTQESGDVSLTTNSNGDKVFKTVMRGKMKAFGADLQGPTFPSDAYFSIYVDESRTSPFDTKMWASLAKSANKTITYDDSSLKKVNGRYVIPKDTEAYFTVTTEIVFPPDILPVGSTIKGVIKAFRNDNRQITVDWALETKIARSFKEKIFNLASTIFSPWRELFSK